MSKFIDAIEAKATGKRVLMPGEFSALSVSQMSTDYACGEIYTFKVSWAISAAIDTRDEQHIDQVKKNVAQELREIIYGDLRTIIFQAQRAAFSRDYKKTIDLLYKAIEEMGNTPKDT
jgi:glucan biosynthesis protein